MAGHSHWANIAHKKALIDNKRGKLWSKLSKAIIVAAKAGGGDVDMNLKLRYADAELSLDIDPEPGAADSGDLESDLATLFVAIGGTSYAAAASHTTVVKNPSAVAT